MSMLRTPFPPISLTTSLQYVATKRDLISTAKQLASMAQDHGAALERLAATGDELTSTRADLERAQAQLQDVLLVRFEWIRGSRSGSGSDLLCCHVTVPRGGLTLMMNRFPCRPFLSQPHATCHTIICMQFVLDRIPRMGRDQGTAWNQTWPLTPPRSGQGLLHPPPA